ncbi:hypothetical protein QP027_07910 [Corynebacterium breve]|uniref:Secreted protein n=1 Tax=Corynebacterium breve TaxID=3049799 RepID=A0ABY8VBK0_9CORY|nr:hypothetical protein [Corynebacterium breve]WIM67050.1 hypothetical protein QP027_07910 [Corynebacterium breve]
MKISRSIVAIASACALTFAGVGANVAYAAEPTQNTTVTTQEDTEDASGSSALSSELGDVELEDQGDFGQGSSDLVKAEAGPFAPLLLKLLPALNSLLSLLDVIVDALGFAFTPSLLGK